jgi:1,4-dihydroxy-2-naphthoate octaprenyltransferase
MFDPAAWIQATRPLAQINIALPLLLGQAMAFAALGRFSPGLMYCAGIFGTLVQLVIVFVNDFADRETDAHNTTFSRFSGGSRVLPEGRIAPATLRRAALVVQSRCSGCSAAGSRWRVDRGCPRCSRWRRRCWCGPTTIRRCAWPTAVTASWCRDSAIGVVLPLAGYYLQAGTLAGFVWPALVPLLLLGYVGNILTALPDAPSDRASDKRSYPVRRGQWVARRHALELLAMAAAMSSWVLPGLSLPATALVAAPALGVAALALPLLGSADAENRTECERFVLLDCGRRSPADV